MVEDQNMSEDNRLNGLVEMAQKGHAESKDLLVREAEIRLRTYIYRVTLDSHVTDDVVQEALLVMLKSLGELKEAGSFKVWLYRIAQSKMSAHYRHRKRRIAVSSSVYYRDLLEKRPDDRERDGLDNLLKKELSRAVMDSMRELKHSYRSVLSLRCFESLSFSEVGSALGCSSLRARITFCRARDALRKRLANRGLDKSLFLLGLSLFGKATAPAEGSAGSVSVVAGAVKVGLPAATLSAISSKFGVATVGAVLVGLGGLGGYWGFSSSSESSLPAMADVKSVHYTVQVLDSSPSGLSSMSMGAYEHWYEFPDGSDECVFMRLQRWDPGETEELCTWLQNAHGNYYYRPGEERVYINNYRIPAFDLSVRRLPTDSVSLSDFISEVEGEKVGIEYARDNRSGLLVSAVDRRFLDAPLFQTTYEYNSVSAGTFDYSWADSVAITDTRDKMHKRGWTWFRISGEINGEGVSGMGRIPFVYGNCEQYWPWLILKVGDEFELVDGSGGAFVRNGDGAAVARYPRGSFFRGLGRPWVGMHAMDVVRRDAARAEVRFDTTLTGDGKEAIVTLFYNRENRNTGLHYTIDIINDLVKCIQFQVDGRSAGELRFTHLQDVGGVDVEFLEPAVDSDLEVSARKDPGMMWLISVAQGKLP